MSGFGATDIRGLAVISYICDSPRNVEEMFNFISNIGHADDQADCGIAYQSWIPSEWSTILLPTKVYLMLEVWQYVISLTRQHYLKLPMKYLSPSYENSTLNSRNSRKYLPGLTLISTWISNHMPSKVWDEITYSFPNYKQLHWCWSLGMDK